MTETLCKFIKKTFPQTLEMLRREGRKEEVLTPSQRKLLAKSFGVDESYIIRDLAVQSEVAVQFCEDQYGYIYPAAMCKGAGCVVDIRGCTIDRIVGSIHTHLGGKPVPSYQDLIVEAIKGRGEWFGIISVRTRDMIMLWNFDKIRVADKQTAIREVALISPRIGLRFETVMKKYEIQVCKGKY